METCPCGIEKPYSECCEPLIKGERQAETPVELMRSRYCAYVNTEVDYIVKTTHPDKQEGLLPEGIRRWSERSTWQGLEIVATEDGGPEDETGIVEFIAHYTEKDIRKKHHELAEFEKLAGVWYFADGTPVLPRQFVREQPKVGRNEPCLCGSGKKFKKCCGK